MRYPINTSDEAFAQRHCERDAVEASSEAKLRDTRPTKRADFSKPVSKFNIQNEESIPHFETRRLKDKTLDTNCAHPYIPAARDGRFFALERSASAL